jgi:cephalosporin hydroxylase
MENLSLRELFYQHTGKLVHKWDHYFEIYEKYFAKYRGQKINMLEIGISHGGSLQLWKKYFGPQVHVYAIDVNPLCKQLEEENTTVFIGSQSNKKFLKEVLQQIPDLDIIIDDGGHTMLQQKVSFETLYMKVKEGGTYIVEDTHTSYWQAFHGGLGNPNSFIEFSKRMIDSLYAGHVHNKKKLLINEITQHINSIAFYDSIVVFEKMKRPEPFHIRKGTETVEPYVQHELTRNPIITRLSKLFGTKDTYALNDKGKAE